MLLPIQPHLGRLAVIANPAPSGLRRITALPRAIHRSSGLGALLLLWLSAGMIIDWWFPLDIENPGVRFWPQTFRLAILILLCVYALTFLDKLLRLSIVRLQILWLLVMCGRLLVTPQFERTRALYIAYYAFWMIVLWAAYCMATSGHLTARQVSVAGALMNVITSAYMLFEIGVGVWIGQADAASNPAEVVVIGGVYGLLWFTLMQILAPIGLVGGAIAISSSILVVLSLERGALISMLLGLLVYAIVHAYVNPPSRKRVMAGLLPALAAIGLAVWLTAGNAAARWADVNDVKTAGSGRLLYWDIITRTWMDADPGTKLFGHGPLSVNDTVGHGVAFAHNDLLEQLHCFGLLGALLFVAVCWAMCRECYRLVRARSNAASVLCAATAVFISSSLYCIVSYSTATVWFSVIAGTLLGTAKTPIRNAARSSVSAAARSPAPVVFSPEACARLNPSRLPRWRRQWTSVAPRR